MIEIKLPFGPEKIVHMGTNAEEVQRVVTARGAFTLAYMERMGWGTDPGQLTIEQILEIREQPEWKNP